MCVIKKTYICAHYSCLLHTYVCSVVFRSMAGVKEPKEEEPEPENRDQEEMDYEEETGEDGKRAINKQVRSWRNIFYSELFLSKIVLCVAYSLNYKCLLSVDGSRCIHLQVEYVLQEVLPMLSCHYLPRIRKKYYHSVNRIYKRGILMTFVHITFTTTTKTVADAS